MFDFVNATSFDDFVKHLNQASGTRGDTRRDRLVALYSKLRREAPSGAWHHIPGLRKFTRQFVNDNPYIPRIIRESEHRSRSVPLDFQSFLDAWSQAGYSRSTFSVNLNSLIETITTDDHVLSKFVSNNLHDVDYFFTKFTEWHTTIECAKRIKAKRILDLGAAYNGFARVATARLPAANVIMADLIFKPGLTDVSPRISELGVNAGKLEGIEDSSIDLICAHNAFEHFCGDADTLCIREMERVLKPGGVAVITPFQGIAKHTLSINPFSCFVAEDDAADMEDAILDETKVENALVRFNPGMVSAFARSYEFRSFKRRLIDQTPSLVPTLREVQFDQDGFDETDHSITEIMGMKVDRTVFSRKRFWVLELSKALNK
ncbi:MAG: class I SAM-dependent methyltransferase [Maricaulis sp.]|nr:class I SAM-dependent methyltransferase [Maricaulis sp.]